MPQMVHAAAVVQRAGRGFVARRRSESEHEEKVREVQTVDYDEWAKNRVTSSVATKPPTSRAGSAGSAHSAASLPVDIPPPNHSKRRSSRGSATGALRGRLK